jgi:UDP-galactopyranose mutase
VNILVVGAGFTGATIARKLADEGHNVHVYEKRDHIAGNAFDHSKNGVMVHKYGPHLFHTNNELVVDFLSRFTTWLPYEHKVSALIEWKGLLENRKQYVPFPPNMTTIADLGLKNEEQVVEIFYRPYTEKMWGMPLEQVNPNILKRVPMREDFETRYFPKDSFQAMPALGYTSLFANILAHPRIKIFLKREIPSFYNTEASGFDHCFWTGTIDSYHAYFYGNLPYRSIHFREIDLDEDLPTATINFTDKGPYTRMTQWAKIPGPHLDPESRLATMEMPTSVGEPFYPVPDVDGKNRELYAMYAALDAPKVTFCGRLGSYAYLNMDMAVSAALAVAKKYIDSLS